MRLKYVKAILGFLFAVLMVVLWWLLVRKLSPKDVSDAATALALLVGGGWTFYQFALRKSFESALQIESAVATEPMGANFVVSIDVVLSNIGNRRIRVPRRLPAKDILHYENSVKYPVDLQVRALATDLPRRKMPPLLNMTSSWNLEKSTTWAPCSFFRRATTLRKSFLWERGLQQQNIGAESLISAFRRF